MSIGFTKSFFTNKSKQSSIVSQEVEFGSPSNEKGYAEKLAVSGLTFDQMDRMYQANVWVRTCVDKIVNRVSEIAPVVKSIKTADIQTGKLEDKVIKEMEQLSRIIEQPNRNNEGFSTIRKKVTRDILRYDAGSIEIVKTVSSNRDINNKIELFAVPASSIKLNVDKKGIFQPDAYIQLDKDMKPINSWKKEKLMYFIMNPQSDKVYGFSPLESLIQTVTADLYSSDYNLNFFYNNATPRFAVMMENVGSGQGGTAVERFRRFWDQELKGKPHRPIILASEGGEIRLEKVGLSNDEMQFQEYSRWLLTKIMAIYNVQPIILGMIDQNMGKLNSAEQQRIFKQDAIKPHLTMMVERFNNQVVFSDQGLGMKNVYLDFDMDLVDKDEQARWHDKYLKTGVLTINEIRVQGLGLQPVSWGNVPYMQNNVSPFGQEGSAVPPTPEQSIVQAPTETAAIPTTLVGKYMISPTTKQPIGWEDFSPKERLEVIEKLIRIRESELSKKFIIPKNIQLGNN